MRNTRVTALLAPLLTIALLTLTACGGEDADEAASSIPESEPFNQADVDFATDMIPHHAQALLMVDAAAPREDLSPEMTELIEGIRTEQTGEIEQMTDWLEDWDQPIPDNPRDHGGMEGDHGGGMDGDMMDMPGMASQEEMDTLADASGPAFEQMWLEMMIEHHEGAIEMAEAEVADGEFPDTVALAEDITTSQAEEIETMESMLDG